MNGTSRWIVGYVGVFVILSLLAESPTTAELSAALAVSIAIGATFVLGPDAVVNLKTMGA